MTPEKYLSWYLRHTIRWSMTMSAEQLIANARCDDDRALFRHYYFVDLPITLYLESGDIADIMRTIEDEVSQIVTFGFIEIKQSPMFPGLPILSDHEYNEAIRMATVMFTQSQIEQCEERLVSTTFEVLSRIC